MSLAAAALWVLAATGVAFLPFRAQIAPGLVLLAAAPAIIVWMGLEHGALAVGVGLAAVVSMFRKPLGVLLRYLLKRARGAGPEPGP